MVQFWNVLYQNVLLEYMYVNGLNWAVPQLEVMQDDCRVAGSVDTATSTTTAITATTATIRINGSDDSTVLAYGKYEKSKDSCSTSSSVKFSEEPSLATGDIDDDVEVEIGSNRKQLIPLGGTYVHNPLIGHVNNTHSNSYSYSYSYSYSHTYSNSHSHSHIILPHDRGQGQSGGLASCTVTRAASRTAVRRRRYARVREQLEIE